jgi:hypothetical protein
LLVAETHNKRLKESSQSVLSQPVAK